MPQNAQNISLATITLSITAILTTYIISKPLSKYGLSGTLRLVWEGDHLPSHIRVSIDQLKAIEGKIKKEKKKINTLSVTIETAKLNSVDEIVRVSQDKQAGEDADEEEEKDYEIIGDTTTCTTRNDDESHVPKRHYILSQVPSLMKDLGRLSYVLDKFAADLDQVSSHGDAEVKRRKKELSKKVVDMMEVCDGFIQECGLDS
mmetsp:Transcript_8941/g.13521  ORF Transcript_8941/g.13521 Transcript_8941/m.13521 type:complete len:203 (-) Transcript_8941:136-744(-)